MKVKKVVPFAKAREKSLFGSKAVGLGDAARKELPVPPGVALSGDLVEAIASTDDKAIEKLNKAIADLNFAGFLLQESTPLWDPIQLLQDTLPLFEIV